MHKVHPLLLLSLLATGAILASCGGGDGSSPTRTGSAAQTQATTTSSGAGEAGSGGQADGGPPSGGEATGGKADDDAGPSSLATNPGSIRGAVVTDAGAVQTLEPDEADQAEAMRNSYASIRAFGEEAEGSEATEITFALLQYLTARAEGDWATACARVYPPLEESITDFAAELGDPSIKDGGCPAAYGFVMERVPQALRDDATQIDVASVRRQDSRAFVIYKTPETLSVDMPMSLNDGLWKVGALEPYALRPGQAE